jgi:hypothetical protein
MSASSSSVSHTLYSNLHISTAMAESTHVLVPIPPLNLCAMCDEPSTQTCSRCNSIRYCSKECQKADFSHQKLLCKTINDFKNLPAPYLFRSIYIPETQGDRIKFIWIPVIVDSILDQSQPFKDVLQSNPRPSTQSSQRPLSDRVYTALVGLVLQVLTAIST